MPLAPSLRLAAAAVAAHLKGRVMGHVHRVRVARLVVLRAAAGALLVQPLMLRPELVGVLGLQPVGERSVLLQ